GRHGRSSCTVKWSDERRVELGPAVTQRQKSLRSSIRICRDSAASPKHSKTGRTCGMSQADPEGKRLDGEIIPPELAVRAMRDSGYRNTAYALAEIIDNSVQAKAKNVDLICIEAYERNTERERRRIQAIGVLDNGTGMSPQTLRIALQFGNGTHLT